MIDQLWGRPSTTYKRTQVVVVLLFWLHQLAKNKDGPPFIRRISSRLSKFTPYQIIVGTITLLYAFKHSDDLLGLSAPEPLARLYSRDYYRATWAVTALDAGFATAMSIAWKPLRDLMSVLFTIYYLIRARAADEKLRRYRAECTVEMLRATWEKTTNPIIRFLSRPDRPKVIIHKSLLLSRPTGSRYRVWLYYDGTPQQLSTQTELVLDIPGGGFIAMNPQHHEERLLRWAKQLKRPVLAIDYSKAPEYPYPYAIDECTDVYKLLHGSQGRCIGMGGGKPLSVVLCGDSAGANLATVLVINLIESKASEPLPAALVYAYPALSFHFTSWLPNEDLGVLRQESFTSVRSLLKGKDAFEHRAPLSVVDEEPSSSDQGSRWSLRPSSPKSPKLKERVLWNEGKGNKVGESQPEGCYQPGTRLAMTSRAAFVNDRILSPSMCRAMAVLYIGPHNAPDLHSDYRISPIFAPAEVLARFPPVYMSCGERDPFVDDTVIFAGKVREAKEARKAEAIRKSTKFGESLRMSSSLARDPILDESEDDWVHVKIIEGWSHGYLQMVALLPKVKGTIAMMADWIALGFAKHASARRTPGKRANTIAAVKSTGLDTTVKTAQVPSVTVQPIAVSGLSDSEKEENEMLSFTPKKRRPSNESRTSSTPGSPTRSLQSNSRSATPDSHRHGRVRRTASDASSSDETYRTKPETADGGSGSRALSRAVTDPLAKSDPADVPEALLARLRSASGSHFVDARELMSRRRREAVQGISSASSASAIASDDE